MNTDSVRFTDIHRSVRRFSNHEFLPLRLSVEVITFPLLECHQSEHLECHAVKIVRKKQMILIALYCNLSVCCLQVVTAWKG